MFVGWYGSDVEFKDGEQVLDICDVGETIRLYPQWKYIAPPVDYGNYTIIFNANGGDGTMVAQTVGVMDSAALSKNTFTREYCDFVGWSPLQEGDDVAFVDEGIVWRIASKGEEVTLYARWKTSENVYFLDEPNNLLTVGENLGGIYVLQNDLKCVQLSLQPFATVNDPFNGIFDGNGFSIEGVSLVGHNNEPSRTSLFGCVGEKGIVKDLSVKHANTVSNVQEAAIFAVNNQGTIENCYAFGCTVEVTDKNKNDAVRNAGLVLENYGTVKNCYFQGNIMSTVPVGEHGGSAGICLVNTGTVESCLIIRTYIAVINDRNTYGKIDSLVGENDGCVQSCFYDIESFSEVRRYTYKEDDNVLRRLIFTSSYGGSINATQLNNRSFYVERLGWSADIWDFSNLNYDNYKYPYLRKK